jgi:hypothetical protein
MSGYALKYTHKRVFSQKKATQTIYIYKFMIPWMELGRPIYTSCLTCD